MVVALVIHLSLLYGAFWHMLGYEKGLLDGGYRLHMCYMPIPSHRRDSIHKIGHF